MLAVIDACLVSLQSQISCHEVLYIEEIHVNILYVIIMVVSIYCGTVTYLSHVCVVHVDGTRVACHYFQVLSVHLMRLKQYLLVYIGVFGAFYFTVCVCE